MRHVPSSHSGWFGHEPSLFLRLVRFLVVATRAACGRSFSAIASTISAGIRPAGSSGKSASHTASQAYRSASGKRSSTEAAAGRSFTAYGRTSLGPGGPAGAATPTPFAVCRSRGTATGTPFRTGRASSCASPTPSGAG
jgi:hypothetical protein